jgi:hypothetical protein
MGADRAAVAPGPHAGMPEEVGMHRGGGAGLPVPRGAQGQHLDAHPGRGVLDDLPGLDAGDHLLAAARPLLPGTDQRLLVTQMLQLLPQEQLPRQVRVAGGEEHGLHRPGRAVAIRQDERVVPDVAGPQGERLADPAAGGPEHPQEQPIPVVPGGGDESPFVP